MSVYTADPAISSGNLVQSEIHLYGSSRLGIFETNRNVQTLVTADYLNNLNTFVRGNKFFELSNHLGNVLVTVSDKKFGVDLTNDGIIDSYNADVVTANDYYPFGMQMPGRKYSAGSQYRYGFNGKENDNEAKGEGNQQDYGFRIYDGRLGRFISIDPLQTKYPSLSPYQYCANSPTNAKDPDGRLIIFINGLWGSLVGISAPLEPYWGSTWVKNVQMQMEGNNSKPPLFFDGSIGGTSMIFSDIFKTNSNTKDNRIAAGERQGYNAAPAIIAGLDKGETINIVTNSMGAAFERGFTKGILKYQVEENERRSTFNAELDIQILVLKNQINNVSNNVQHPLVPASKLSQDQINIAVNNLNSKISELKTKKQELLSVVFENVVDLSSHEIDYADPNAQNSYYMMADKITEIQKLGGFGVKEKSISGATQLGVNPDGTSRMTGHTGSEAKTADMPVSTNKPLLNK